MNFTAIDFETATPKRGSVCSVGAAKFRHGQLVETFYRLVRPADVFGDFDPRLIGVHGIQQHQVANSPEWCDVFPELETFIGGDLLVAHNASFDMSVLNQACAAYQINPGTRTYRCTVQLAKARLVLPNYKLPTVANALGVPLTSHHNAAADAIAAGEVAVRLL